MFDEVTRQQDHYWELLANATGAANNAAANTDNNTCFFIVLSLLLNNNFLIFIRQIIVYSYYIDFHIKSQVFFLSFLLFFVKTLDKSAFK